MSFLVDCSRWQQPLKGEYQLHDYLEIDDVINQADVAAPLVVMMCGVAGSGKTTLAQRFEKRGFVRLSIDEEIWATHGRYGIDYPIEMYEQLKVEAEIKLRNELVNLLNGKRNVVVDFSFWQRKRRNEYKKLIEDGGGVWKLIYLKVHPNELRERLRIRSQRFDANAAFTITEDILSSFLEGFEVPTGEGEMIIEANS